MDELYNKFIVTYIILIVFSLLILDGQSQSSGNGGSNHNVNKSPFRMRIFHIFIKCLN